MPVYCYAAATQVAFQLQLLQKYDYESRICISAHTTHFAGCYALTCELCLQTAIAEGIDIRQTYKLCYTYRKVHKTPVCLCVESYSVCLCVESTVIDGDQEGH